jgi:carbonic anhydrase
LDNLGNSPVIREFLHNGGELELHATVFDMHNGHIKVLESLNTKDGKFVPMDLSPDILK